MNKCEKCGFLHYRTDPCRRPKEPLTLPVGEKQPRTRQPQGTRNEGMPTNSTGQLDKSGNSGEGYHGLPVVRRPVDNSRTRKKALAGEVPSVNEQPETVGKLVQVQQSGPATKFDKKAWMRDYMREHRRGIRRRAAK